MMMPKVPWDLAVFLTITTVGFGYSVKRLVNQDIRPSISLASAADMELVDAHGSGGHASVDLGCLEQRLSGQQITAEQSAIRLRGKFCMMSRHEMHKFEGVSVKNLTNGFEGTIFFHGSDATFVTDSVALKPGVNKIQLEWRARPEAKPSRFVAEVVQQ